MYARRINEAVLMITIVVTNRISSEVLVYGKICLVVSRSIIIIASKTARVRTANLLLTLMPGKGKVIDFIRSQAAQFTVFSHENGMKA